MKRAVLEQILRAQEHVNVEGERYTLAEGLRADLLVVGGSTEAIAVSGVRELVLGELFVSITTDKDERFFLEYEHVFALRTKGKATGHPIGRAGFAAG